MPMDAAVKFPTSPKAVKAAPLKLSKRMSVEQAFQAIVRSCIDQVQANEAGVTQVHDMESLHQMRVGLRRLRAAVAMFSDVLNTPDEIKAELAWMMDQLAEARDWDVLLASTLPQVELALEQPGVLARLRQATGEKISASHALVAQAVASPRFQQLVSKLDQWQDQRGWRDDRSPHDKKEAHRRIVDFAGGILGAERERLHKRGQKLKGATPEERHRVRIAAKRTRYAAEFFASLYPGKRVRPFVAAVSALQTELGAMNDATVGQRMLDTLCEGNEGLREEAALVRGFLAAGNLQSLQRVRGVWKKVAPLNMG